MSASSTHPTLFEVFGKSQSKALSQINEKAASQLSEILTSSSEKIGAIILLRSPRAGYGKTLLLESVSKGLSDKFKFMAVEPSGGGQLDSRVILESVVKSLSQTLPASGGLSEFDFLARRILALGLKPLLISGEVPSHDREGALFAIENRPVETFDFHHQKAATAHWTQGNFEILGPRLAAELSELSGASLRGTAFWLDVLFSYATSPPEKVERNRDLTQSVFEELGNSGKHELEERLQTLLSLQGLVQPLVLVFDETEGLSNQPEMGLGVAALMAQLRQACPALAIILSVNEDVWSTGLEPLMPGGLVDRLTEYEVTLEALSQKDAEKLAKDRFGDDNSDWFEQVDWPEPLFARAVLREAALARKRPVSNEEAGKEDAEQIARSIAPVEDKGEVKVEETVDSEVKSESPDQNEASKIDGDGAIVGAAVAAAAGVGVTAAVVGESLAPSEDFGSLANKEADAEKSVDEEISAPDPDPFQGADTTLVEPPALAAEEKLESQSSPFEVSGTEDVLTESVVKAEEPLEKVSEPVCETASDEKSVEEAPPSPFAVASNEEAPSLAEKVGEAVKSPFQAVETAADPFAALAKPESAPTLEGNPLQASPETTQESLQTASEAESPASPTAEPVITSPDSEPEPAISPANPSPFEEVSGDASPASIPPVEPEPSEPSPFDVLRQAKAQEVQGVEGASAGAAASPFLATPSSAGFASPSVAQQAVVPPTNPLQEQTAASSVSSPPEEITPKPAVSTTPPPVAPEQAASAPVASPFSVTANLPQDPDAPVNRLTGPISARVSGSEDVVTSDTIESISTLTEKIYVSAVKPVDTPAVTPAVSPSPQQQVVPSPQPQEQVAASPVQPAASPFVAAPAQPSPAAPVTESVQPAQPVQPVVQQSPPVQQQPAISPTTVEAPVQPEVSAPAPEVSPQTLVNPSPNPNAGLVRPEQPNAGGFSFEAPAPKAEDDSNTEVEELLNQFKKRFGQPQQ